MKILRFFGVLLLLFFFIIHGIACSKKANNSVIRVGYFPNITHAQAVLGLANGTFASYLGPEIKIKTTLFNAGPSIIEAVFSGDIDIAYVGPSPAINGYVRSGGKAFKVVSGVVSGGALFIVRPDSGMEKAADLSEKRIASPQLGNTQDIALREYLRKSGLKPRERGGTVNILPLRNPDILNLFMRKQIDGAWVPEPWGTRLVIEGKGKIFLDEKSLWKDGRFCSTLIIVGTDFLQKHPDLVKRWLGAHVKISRWINQHPKKAKKIICKQIKVISGIQLPKEVIDGAFSKLEITYDPVVLSLVSYAEMAYNAGFLGEKMPDLSGMIDLRLLNEVLKEKSLPLVDER
ncbi:MAG: ABC-type probable sulfate transporter, periplasmic binding protein [Candidatus Jettenia ecosi]|uniref:ABC-type probable sulfate transporter, periplasmic binding protein n=1 Tax=Candidatus Jettenia ecosi TaxID=2494326 RepID=A0A533QCY5_9BACT|nr:MAG: ABC-type probable sulfate transporter, periplasmic binding protein [Candidatus Jettenia ecosi]